MNRIEEICEQIRLNSKFTGSKLQIHQAPPEAIQQIGGMYNLKVFSPEDHRLDFWFVRGYYGYDGSIQSYKKDSYGSFSITSQFDICEAIYLKNGEGLNH